MAAASQDGLVFITSAGKLQDMAATKLALEFWCQKIDKGYSNSSPCFQWFSAQTICAEEFVHVPRIIGRIIDAQIEALRTDLKEWMYYNLARVFFDRDHREAILRCIHEVRFKSNCTIDHNETAKRLLKCKKLTVEEKRRIPHVWYERDFMSRSLVSFCPFGDTILQINNWYVDKVSCKDGECKNVALYWDTLSVENQLTYARRSFRENPYSLIFLLPRMKVEALNRIMQEKSLKIVCTFAQCARNSEYAYQTWLFIENRASSLQFFEVIGTLLEYRSHMNNRYYEDDYIDTLVLNIWTRAPRKIKEFLLNSDNSDRIVTKLCRVNEYFVKDLRRSLDFLLEFLSNKDFTFKNELWMRCWRDLIVGSRLSHLDELMRVCLKNGEQVTRFKQTLLLDFISETNAKKYYDLLIRKRYHSELNAFLNFCTGGDKQLVANFRRDLLLSKNNEIYLIFNCHNTASVIDFDDFIEQLVQDEDLANEIKNQVIMLPENLAALYKKIENFDLLAVKDLLCCFVTSKNDLDSLKSTFLNVCRGNLIEGKLYNFEIPKWQKFLEWCFNDDPEGYRTRDFVESIPIDEIFSNALVRCVQWQRYLLQYGCRGTNRENSMRGTLGKCDFYELSDFLRWYFKSAQAAFDFKMTKVKEYKGFGKIRKEFEAESDDAYIILEDWFFEGWPNPYVSLCRL